MHTESFEVPIEAGSRTAWATTDWPKLYVAAVVCCALAAFSFKLRTDGVFACPADGYEGDRYLAYCQATGFADYDHGAFWFGLEPDAQRAVSDAQVLFLGSSRMQFALSTSNAREWFDSRSIRRFLLGFSHTENVSFVAPLLRRLDVHARVYVINVDHFFDDRVTIPTRGILSDSVAQESYRRKRTWQTVHRHICGVVSSLCGTHVSFFRSRSDGAWELKGTEPFETTPTADGQPTNPEQWGGFAEIASRFLSGLAVEPGCVVLTIVPYTGTQREEAASIAAAAGLELVAPQLDALYTFDGSHLDQVSAARWSAAFLEAAGPRIVQCLK